MRQPGPPAILLVTPDAEWSQSLCFYLAQNGFTLLTTASTGEQVLTLVQQVLPHLVLLDRRVLDDEVVDLCAAIRQAHVTVKIVLVSATEPKPQVLARYGQISGLIKPDLPLLAWPGLLTYILQGGVAFSQNAVEDALAEVRFAPPPALILGALQIDLTQKLVHYAGQRIYLTAREFALLAYLAHHPDHVITVDQLLSEAWGYDSEHGTPAQVRLYITRLRRKLLANAQLRDCIRTARGAGYRLDSTALR